jgi:dTDP-4-dehydrorhamnose reductase
MKILVLGANGQVGSELPAAMRECSSHKLRDSDLHLVDRSSLDLCSTDKIKKFLTRFEPTFIVNAAAYTAVDSAESEEITAVLVNSTAVREIAEYCRDSGSRLIHISTDYVFDGAKSAPYVESDEASPVGVYGRSKLEGEHAIREMLTEHIILRTSWVFGRTGSNFVKTMLRLSETKEELGVVADQIGAPTSARQIAKTIAAIICVLIDSDAKESPWGTYHYSGLPFVSWADFSDKIFEHAMSNRLIRRSPRLKRINTADYPTKAARPANSRLDSSKVKRVFDIDPDDWESSLIETLSDLKQAS